MFKTVSSELYRLRKSTGFWIMVLVAGFLAALSSVLMGVLPLMVPGEDLTGLAPESVSQMLNSAMGSNISSLLFILVGFVVVFITSDFSAGTVRNPLAIGISRLEYVVGKFVSILVTCACFVVVTLVATALPYFAFAPWGGENFYMAHFLGGVAIAYLILVTQASIFTMVAMFMRKTGATLGIAIGYLVVDMLVGAFVTVSAMFMDINVFIRGLLNILPTPAGVYLNEVSIGVADTTNVLLLIGVSVFIMAVTAWLSITTLSKKDV